jgi:DNA primase
MEIKDIKARLNIFTVLSHYNLKADKNHMLNCPFHKDGNASMKIYPQTNTFNCFGCDKNGDVIEFIQEKENCSKHQALLKATELCGNTPMVKEEPKQAAPLMQNHTIILNKVFTYFQNGLSHAKNPREYLQSRNLNHELLEIGYNSGQFHHRGKLSETDLKACISAGLLIGYNGKIPNAKGQSYTAFAKDCIIFPLKNKKGEIVSIYGRSIINNDKSKHYYLKDRQGLYPNYPSREARHLIITEAIIDAATLVQIPEITEKYEILSLYGTNGLTEKHQQAIKELKDLEEITFFFDGDKAGTEAIAKHEKTLKQLRPEIELSTVITPDNEDVNSLLQGHETEILTHLIENRIPLMKKVEKEVLKNQLFEEKAQTQLNTSNPDFITFTTNELQIIILGGINLQQLDRLRITLKISRLDTNDPLHSIRHTLDLYHSDYLEKFINKASEQLETGTNIIRRAIAELTDQIENYRLSKIESQKQQKPKTTPIIRREIPQSGKLPKSPKTTGKDKQRYW